MGTYVIRKSRDYQYYFNLKAGNGQVILTSETYAAKQSAKTGIDSVRKNSPEDSKYERKERSGSYSFTLKAANGEPIGRSETYSTSSARDQGIESVKNNGPSSTTVDETGE